MSFLKSPQVRAGLVEINELQEKIMNTNYLGKYTEIHNAYKQSLLTKDEIYDTFESKLFRIIGE